MTTDRTSPHLSNRERRRNEKNNGTSKKENKSIKQTTIYHTDNSMNRQTGKPQQTSNTRQNHDNQQKHNRQKHNNQQNHDNRQKHNDQQHHNKNMAENRYPLAGTSSRENYKNLVQPNQALNEETINKLFTEFFPYPENYKESNKVISLFEILQFENHTVFHGMLLQYFNIIVRLLQQEDPNYLQKIATKNKKTFTELQKAYCDLEDFVNSVLLARGHKTKTKLTSIALMLQVAINPIPNAYKMWDEIKTILMQQNIDIDIDIKVISMQKLFNIILNNIKELNKKIREFLPPLFSLIQQYPMPYPMGDSILTYSVVQNSLNNVALPRSDGRNPDVYYVVRLLLDPQKKVFTNISHKEIKNLPLEEQKQRSQYKQWQMYQEEVYKLLRLLIPLTFSIPPTPYVPLNFVDLNCTLLFIDKQPKSVINAPWERFLSQPVWDYSNNLFSRLILATEKFITVLYSAIAYNVYYMHKYKQYPTFAMIKAQPNPSSMDFKRFMQSITPISTEQVSSKPQVSTEQISSESPISEKLDDQLFRSSDQKPVSELSEDQISISTESNDQTPIIDESEDQTPITNESNDKKIISEESNNKIPINVEPETTELSTVQVLLNAREKSKIAVQKYNEKQKQEEEEEQLLNKQKHEKESQRRQEWLKQNTKKPN